MGSTFVACGRQIIIRGRLLRIASIDGDGFRFLDNPEPIISTLRASAKRIDLFTFVQRLPETTPKYKHPFEWDNFAALQISTFDNWWNEVLGFKGRNKAKQAEKKGVQVREIPLNEELIEGIWQIYNECPIRQGKRFPHYGMTREEIREYAGTFLDCSVFLGAFLDESLIGFAKLTIDESGTQAGLMHIISLIAHREKAPTNALIAQAVRSCEARGIPYLVYAKFGYGKKRRDSLSDFKGRNGFQRVDIPRYYVPLSPLGNLAFRAGMHRKIVDFLPEFLIAKLRSCRAALYRASSLSRSNVSS